MKKFLIIGMIVTGFTACSGANDGNPKTDTTTMPVDTNLNKTESNHLNRPTGTDFGDTVQKGQPDAHIR